jgi:hypothetical protein
MEDSLNINQITHILEFIEQTKNKYFFETCFNQHIVTVYNNFTRFFLSPLNENNTII